MATVGTEAAPALAQSDTHLHNFSGYLPVIHLPGGIQLPTYFLVVSVAFCVCLYWLVRRTDQRGLSRNDGLDLALVVMIFGLIGARLFHVLFEEPAYYLESPARVLEIWRGGFVWYGGALTSALGFVLYSRRRHLPTRVWLDIYAPLCALGYAAGRVACVLVGCCFGRACDLFDSYRFLYPAQIFAVIWELSVLAILLIIERTRRSGGTWIRNDGQLLVLWLILHSIGRIIMEAFRGDPRGPQPLGVSLSTWMSCGILIASLVTFMRTARARGINK